MTPVLLKRRVGKISFKSALLLKLIMAAWAVRELRKQRFQCAEQQRQAAIFQLKVSINRPQTGFDETAEIAQVTRQALQPAPGVARLHLSGGRFIGLFQGTSHQQPGQKDKQLSGAVAQIRKAMRHIQLMGLTAP